MSKKQTSSISSDSASDDNSHAFHIYEDTNSPERTRNGYRIFGRPLGFGNRMPSSSTGVKIYSHKKKILWSTVLILLVTSLAIITWLSLILTVASRLRIPPLTNGLQHLLQTYHAPNSTNAAYPTWLPDFSNGIVPAQCHSHNDYWHRIPLYEGLAAGCVSTEADIWVGNVTGGGVELFVGHNSKSLSASRTLRSLYLNPLADILDGQNGTGIFSASPNTSFVLLLDFKTEGQDTWDAIVSQLEPLRAKDLLTYWSPSSSLVQRPLTIVASGVASFASIVTNTTYRDIFYDAPLTQLSESDSPYNSNNSYYASSSLSKAVGSVKFGKFSSDQKTKLSKQVQSAKDVG